MARDKKEGNNFFKNWDKSKLIMVAVPTVIIALLSVVWVRAMVSTNKKTAVSETSEVSEGDIATDSNAQVDIVPAAAIGAPFPSLSVDVATTEPVPDVIRAGTKHPIVHRIQERLMRLGFMENDEPTDYYGDVTIAAVKVFQRQNKLPQDGIIGTGTLEILMADDAKFYAAQEGDVGTDIERIQSRLYELGYLAEQGQITGTYDEKTKDAVSKLQEINSLDQDGKVGIKTLNLIYSEDIKPNMLAYGEKSDVVMAIQKRLFELGYMTSTPDGSYGLDTSLAVKQFQSKNDQVVDGYIGPSTRMAILSADAKPNGLGVGDQSDQVHNIQKMLAKWGYLHPDNITGYFGESTQNAVKAFQSRNGLDSDGSVGAVTIAKLTSDDVLRPLPSTTARQNNGRNGNAGGGNAGGGNAGGGNSGGGGGGATGPIYSGGGSVGNLISVASSKVGSPYVWGAKGPNAFDCSGFIYWCLNNSGVSQSYMTSSGWRNPGRYTRVSNFSDLQAGDIIVVSGHVGLVAGGGQIIDASSSNGRVVQRSLGGWWQRNFIVGWRIF